MQVAGWWIDIPVGRFCVSMCLPVHKQFKILVLSPYSVRLELQTFVYDAVTKEFMTIFTNEYAFLMEHSSTPW